MEDIGPVHTTVEDGVAVLVMDYPPVNAFHPDLLNGLFKSLERSQADPGVKAIVITGAPERFSAGMDLSVLQSGLDVTSGRGTVLENMTHQVEAGPKPVVAAAAGSCLGAALELSLACAARLASSDAQLGLPEVRLGLLPGLAGTVRLPRLVGLQPALNLITAGLIVDAGKALELGLVDELVPDRDQLIPRAKELAAALADSPNHPLAQRAAVRDRTDMLPAPEQTKAMLKEARAKAHESWAQPRSVLLCIDAVEAGVLQGPEVGEALEGEYFDAALSLASHKALVRAFFAQRAVRKARGQAWLVRWLYSLWARLGALFAICWEWWRWGMAAPPLLAKDL